MRRRYWWVTVSVLVMLVVAVVVVMRTGSGASRGTDVAPGPVAAGPINVRVQKLAPPVDASAAGMADAFAAYNAGDYAKAIAAFGQAEKRNPDSVVPPLYMGVSQLFTNDNAGALTSLQAASQFEEDTYQNDADWYMAIAALRTHSSEAQPLFHHICVKRGAAHAAEACAVEKRLPR